MARRPTIQDLDEFDDDTDLPLPSRSLPNTGTRGAILEQISDDESSDQEDDDAEDFQPQLSSTSQPRPPVNIPLPTQIPGGPVLVTDVTPYKNWTCIYPIYIDAKRPYGTGQRRVAREKSVWWPVSQAIADAVARVGFATFHEPQKTHPRDWENPGRVKVQWKKDGRLLNPRIKTKKQLLEAIALNIQKADKTQIPLPEQIEPKSTPVAGDGKKHKPRGKHLPKPPEPFPPIQERLSPMSPLAEAGVLVETVKVALGQQATAEKGDGPGGSSGGKGKRKIVRVRA